MESPVVVRGIEVVKRKPSWRMGYRNSSAKRAQLSEEMSRE
jgi:hypothetical protein